MLKRLDENITEDSPCALLLGGFDGIHIGHKTLLDAAKETGLPVFLTSICGGKAGGDLFSFEEREYIYRKAGCSLVWEIPFTQEFKDTGAEEFLRILFSRFHVGAVFCGEDFTFGKGAAGTPALLKQLAPCAVRALSLKTVDGEKVASSKIKNLLGEGNMKAVNALLFGKYFLQGSVEHGRHVGHALGFPTVNLSIPKAKFRIREGVYGGFVETEQGRYPAIVNFGSRPTFGVSEQKTEAYLDGFSGDLYGQTVRVYPTEFYRPIAKFESKDALIAQLKRDIGRLRATKGEDDD